MSNFPIKIYQKIHSNTPKNKAYGLSSPSDSKKFYDEWAPRYDTDFYNDIDRENYGYPKKLADIYFSLANRKNTPIADIGCGTGALGKHFKGTNFVIDGFDISSGMLIEARKKRYYRNLYECDITKSKDLPKEKYRGLISCGAFTFGHLGPLYLSGVVGMLKKGGLGVIGVNKEYFITCSFENEIFSLKASGVIKNLRFYEEPTDSKKTGEDLRKLKDAEINKMFVFAV